MLDYIIEFRKFNDDTKNLMYEWNDMIKNVELKIERNVVMILHYEKRKISIKYKKIIKKFRFQLHFQILTIFDQKNVNESIVKIETFAFEYRFRRRKNVKLFFKIKNSFIFIDENFIYEFWKNKMHHKFVVNVDHYVFFKKIISIIISWIENDVVSYVNARMHDNRDYFHIFEMIFEIFNFVFDDFNKNRKFRQIYRKFIMKFSNRFFVFWNEFLRFINQILDLSEKTKMNNLNDKLFFKFKRVCVDIKIYNDFVI